MFRIQICFARACGAEIAPIAAAEKCDANIYHMKSASLRDLRYNFKKVEHLLSQGEEVQITKRRKVIARLVPEKPAERPPMPDFAARLKAIYGDKIHEVSGAELIRMDRDRF